MESKAADEEFDVEAELKEAMSRIKHPDRSTLVSSNQSNPSKLNVYICFEIMHFPFPSTGTMTPLRHRCCWEWSCACQGC